IFLLRTSRSSMSSPFPYTTLFRSSTAMLRRIGFLPRSRFARRRLLLRGARGLLARGRLPRGGRSPLRHGFRLHVAQGRLEVVERSEEHTSELQSRENLVCRLLLEK